MLCKGLGSVFKKSGFQIVFKSRNLLKNLLGNPKDKVPPDQSSGIYELKCKDCDSFYVGQTKRKLATRANEHKSYFEKSYSAKSSFSDHLLDNDHHFDYQSLKLLKGEYDRRFLNSWESFYIFKSQFLDNKILVNDDAGPISDATLFRVVMT